MWQERGDRGRTQRTSGRSVSLLRFEPSTCRIRDTQYRSWSGHYAKSRVVGGSIPDKLIEISIDLNLPAAVCPWGRLSL